MRVKIYLYLLILILGMALSSIITYCSIQNQNSKKNNEIRKSLRLTMRYEEFGLCSRAYFQGRPETAIFEIESFISNRMLFPKDTDDPMWNINLFIANARLAKLYKDIGNREKSELYFRSAITNYNEEFKGMSDASSICISNDAGVLRELERYDSTLKPK